MQNSSIGAGISVRLTFCCPCSRGIWMFWTESSHCFHARGKMSYVPFPIRKHRFTVCQNVHCGFGWRIMRSGLGFVACYVREAGIRPDVGRGIFRRGTLRRMGSVFPGLPRRLYGNDLIGMSIGVAVGCGRRRWGGMEAAYLFINDSFPDLRKTGDRCARSLIWSLWALLRRNGRSCRDYRNSSAGCFSQDWRAVGDSRYGPKASFLIYP